MGVVFDVVANTSKQSVQLVDPDERRATMTRILIAITEKPRTARMLAKDLGINEHEAGRRLSDLVSEGYAVKAEQVKNPDTGFPAYLHTATSEGRHYLRTGVRPKAPVKRGELVKSVIQAARNVHDPEGELREALRALDAHDRGVPQKRLPAPYGDPRRVGMALDGVWLRTSGDVILIKHMNDYHLRGALDWLARHGCPWDDALTLALRGEQERRLQ